MRAIWLAISLFACAGGETIDPPPVPDAGVETDAGNATFEPSPIAEPEPPRIEQLRAPEMTPCPDGWREVPASESGFTSASCDPFPNGSDIICNTDEAQFPGTPGCTRVGSECPVEIWAADLPSDRPVVFVRANSPGGDGTQNAPYGTIAQAIAAAADGTVIAIAKGSYDEAIILNKAVTLWGACVAETVLEESGFVGAVRVEASGAELRNLRIAGSEMGVHLPDANAMLHLQDVVIAAASSAGIVAEGGMLTGDRVVVRETFEGGWYGRGLVAITGAVVDLATVELFGNQDAAVFASGMSTRVSLSDVTIRDTLGSPGSGDYGMAAVTLEGAGIELVRAGLARNRNRGVWAYSGSIALTDAVIRDMRSSASDMSDGYGATADNGGHLMLQRVLIDGGRAVGVYLSDEGGSGSLTDVIVHHFEPDLATGMGGRGINAQLGVDLTMERVLVKNVTEMGVFVAADTHAKLTDVAIEDVHNVGVLGTGLTFNFTATGEVDRLHISRATQGGIAIGGGSTATMNDVLIEDSLGLESDQSEGLGIAVQEASQLTAARMRVERCRDNGVYIRDSGTVATIDDLVVREIQSDSLTGRFGRGVAAEIGASVTLRRAMIESTREHALMVNAGGAVMIGEDIRVNDTASRDTDGQAGRGVAVQVDAHLELTRAHFSNNHEVGLFISGAAVTATLTDVVVELTESRPDGVGGRGLDVSLGARVIARGLLLRDNREFGAVAVHEGSRIDLFDAIVTGTRENACPTEECLGFGKGGTGVAAAKKAAVRMNHFVVEKSAVAGLALTREGSIDLADGEVAFNPVGVNVDSEGYDLDRLRRDVRYHDNELTLQSISLPEPRASDVIAGGTD